MRARAGDLVRFSNRPDGPYYIVVSEDAHDIHNGKYLPDCVMIALLEIDGVVPMDRKFLKVVSRAK
tara:strand:- start:27 stop:224 length:198 start_codon:yes stop_codon:yes gene_type:complete